MSSAQAGRSDSVGGAPPSGPPPASGRRLVERPRGRPWLPPFLVGVALAVLMQVAAGLLLYGGPGLVPALTVVLAVGAVSLGAGLSSGFPGLGSERRGARLRRLAEEPVQRARRSWLALLGGFVIAAAFSAGWEVFQGYGAHALSQGVGLATLVALPLYLGGRILTLLRTGGAPPGAPFWGAAAGFLLVGHLFFPILSPTAVLLVCVAIVSGGALAHGWLLDEVVQVREIPLAGGLLLREELRRLPLLSRRTLEAPARVLATRGEGGQPLDPLDEALEEILLPRLRGRGPVVTVGWRALLAAARSQSGHPGAEETTPASLVALLDTEAEVARVALPELLGHDLPPFLRFEERLSPELRPTLALLSWAGEEPEWQVWRHVLAPTGVLLVVGIPDGPGEVGILPLLRRAQGHFPHAHGWVGPEPREGILVLSQEHPEADVLSGGAPGGERPDRVGRLVRVEP